MSFQMVFSQYPLATIPALPCQGEESFDKTLHSKEEYHYHNDHGHYKDNLSY